MSMWQTKDVGSIVGNWVALTREFRGVTYTHYGWVERAWLCREAVNYPDPSDGGIGMILHTVFPSGNTGFHLPADGTYEVLPGKPMEDPRAFRVGC